MSKHIQIPAPIQKRVIILPSYKTLCYYIMPTLLFIGIFNGSANRHRPGLHRPHTTYRTTAPGRINNSNIMPKTLFVTTLTLHVLDIVQYRHKRTTTHRQHSCEKGHRQKCPDAAPPRRYIIVSSKDDDGWLFGFIIIIIYATYSIYCYYYYIRYCARGVCV